MKKSFFAALMTFALVSFLNLKAQGLREKIADKKFNKLEFAEAAEIYEELIKGKSPKTKYYIRAGESFLNIGNYKKAELYYSRAYESQGMTDRDLYNYFQALRYNGKYDKAQEVLGRININEYKNIRAGYKKQVDYLSKLKKDSSSKKVILVQGVNTEESEFSPYIVGNEMYFASSRRNTGMIKRRYGWDNSYYLDVYRGFIEGNEVRNPSRVGEGLKTPYHEGPVFITKDGKTMFITRNNYYKKKLKKGSDNEVNLKIFYRTLEGEKWSDWKEFPYNSDDYSCGHPTLTDDGKTMYFVSDMPGGLGMTDIWKSTYENGNWTKPENMGQVINSEGRELFPMLFENEVLFFASDGKVGLGGLDIFYAVPGTDAFFEPQNLGYPINSSYDDFGVFMKDMKSGYFSSNRPGGKGKDDIYFFVSEKPLLNFAVNLIVRDKKSREVVPNAEVTLTDENGKVIEKSKSDEKGDVKFSLIPGKNYKILVNKSSYKDLEEELKESEIMVLGNSKKELLIEKKEIGLLCLVADADDLKPIEGVKVTITDAFNKNNVLTFVTDKNGDFRHIFTDKKVGDELSYIVKLEKEGYITKVQPVDITIVKEGFILLHEYLNTKMYKVKVGTDIGKIIDLKPIYFDLGKWNIRPDAAVELDKIVQIMKENPHMVIELGSHTDCRGSASSNLLLSDKRAKSSAAYIISKGIDKSRIYGKGYGESKLVNNCACEGPKPSPCSEEQHAQNRRTEFKIVRITK
jgi:outer membrane protein OmpA-like peptidoglycan-associated protein/tetratricopeptide (TPR) repeat protein